MLPGKEQVMADRPSFCILKSYDGEYSTSQGSSLAG